MLYQTGLGWVYHWLCAKARCAQDGFASRIGNLQSDASGCRGSSLAN